MVLEMTGSAITIHLETYISRQAKTLYFKAGQHFIFTYKSAKHFSFQGRQTPFNGTIYHKIKIEEEHQVIVIIDISMHYASFTYIIYMLYQLMCF